MSLATLVLSGCMGLPMVERQQNATTELAEKWSQDRKETLTVAIQEASKTSALTGNPTEIKYETDTESKGNGDQSTISSWEESIPAGAKLILLVIGLLGLLLVFKIVLSKSAAARAAKDLAESVLVGRLNKLKGKLQANGLTPEDKASTLEEMRDLEAQRGKLTRR